MSSVRERLRHVLARPTCTLAATIFDPLSARIAHMLEYEVCMLSRSVGKVATLAAPDIVLSNTSDVVEHCRRITRMADMSLMVDAEDGFGNAVNVIRTVKELEAAGVAAIEIEDNVPPRFSEPAIPRPWCADTPEASAYPILRPGQSHQLFSAITTGC